MVCDRNYVDSATAQADGLYSVSGNTVTLRADDQTVLSASGPGRNSFRLMSNNQYSTHVAMCVDEYHFRLLFLGLAERTSVLILATCPRGVGRGPQFVSCFFLFRCTKCSHIYVKGPFFSLYIRIVDNAFHVRSCIQGMSDFRFKIWRGS